jgi:hypothetical protein
MEMRVIGDDDAFHLQFLRELEPERILNFIIKLPPYYFMIDLEFHHSPYHSYHVFLQREKQFRDAVFRQTAMPNV